MLTSDRAYLWPSNCRSLCTAAHSRLRRSWPLTARLRRANGAPSARHWERVLNPRRALNRKRVYKEWQLTAMDIIRSSLSIQCTSLHSRIVSPARRYIKPCRLTADWEHRKWFRAMAPRPSFFGGNHCGTSPSFFERIYGSACRRALHFLMENVVVALVFEWKSLF